MKSNLHVFSVASHLRLTAGIPFHPYVGLTCVQGRHSEAA